MLSSWHWFTCVPILGPQIILDLLLHSVPQLILSVLIFSTAEPASRRVVITTLNLYSVALYIQWKLYTNVWLNRCLESLLYYANLLERFRIIGGQTEQKMHRTCIECNTKTDLSITHIHVSIQYNILWYYWDIIILNFSFHIGETHLHDGRWTLHWLQSWIRTVSGWPSKWQACVQRAPTPRGCKVFWMTCAPKCRVPQENSSHLNHYPDEG